MAKFKVGQRVRVIASETKPQYVGREATIEHIGRYALFTYGIRIDGAPPSRNDDDLYGADDDNLAPLTDPGADAFIERIKKLRPYEEPKVAPRQTEFSGRT